MKQLIALLFKRSHWEWRVYYPDGTRTRKLTYYEASSLQDNF